MIQLSKIIYIAIAVGVLNSGLSYAAEISAQEKNQTTLEETFDWLNSKLEKNKFKCTNCEGYTKYKIDNNSCNVNLTFETYFIGSNNVNKIYNKFNLKNLHGARITNTTKDSNNNSVDVIEISTINSYNKISSQLVMFDGSTNPPNNSPSISIYIQAYDNIPIRIVNALNHAINLCEGGTDSKKKEPF
jgi:hypothetical protein